ncbi:MAG: protein-tyrosine phosphatase-like protein [Linnemannia gamsii]|nr:MAG: protein-tyrosine phosphatase-like protein [Linnemannia gamsii]
MSMATATVENSQHTATEDILTDTATLGKGKVPNATAAATAEVTQDDSGTAGAAIVSDNSEEASIEFVSREQPDSTITATENMATTATASAPFEGDGADPAQPVPSRSTFDWLAYTVSLNYNRLAASLLSPLTHWHWHDPISNTSIILGAVPSQHLLFQLKRDHGVQNIVNMCAEFKGYLQTMKELGLVQCWLPTRDFSTPSVENIWAGVRFIEKCEKGWNERGEEGRGKIYVHCKAGRGRSATVVLSWLVYCYKLTVIEAQVILLKARGQVRYCNVYH